MKRDTPEVIWKDEAKDIGKKMQSRKGGKMKRIINIFQKKIKLLYKLQYQNKPALNIYGKEWGTHLYAYNNTDARWN